MGVPLSWDREGLESGVVGERMESGKLGGGLRIKEVRRKKT